MAGNLIIIVRIANRRDTAQMSGSALSVSTVFGRQLVFQDDITWPCVYIFISLMSVVSLLILLATCSIKDSMIKIAGKDPGIVK